MKRNRLFGIQNDLYQVMGGGILKLQQIYMENYRGVRELTLDLDGKCVVLYGINGVGKSSILRGITQIFSSIIANASSGQIKQQVTFAKEDVRFGASKLSIQSTFRFDDGVDEIYVVTYTKTARFAVRKEKREFFTAFSDRYPGETESFPIFSYYGVNRAVLDIPVRIRTKHDFGAISAYQNSIGQTDFRTFFEWFRNQEDIENQEKVTRRDLEYVDPALDAVRASIMSMIPELTNIRIVRNPLRMCATKNGMTLRIEQFSDGEKCLLAMLGDIARRLAIANPHASNPLQGNGIVLIDEVDLHMHPKWQQQIAPMLHKTFPNVQFILTTHSPLVLGGLDEDFKVFKLIPGEGDVGVQEMVPAYYDANMVLKDKMGTPFISPDVDQIVKQISDCLARKAYDEAEDNLHRLDRMTRGTHPAITQARTLISMAKRRKREADR